MSTQNAENEQESLLVLITPISSVIILIICSLGYDVSRSGLDLHIYLADIFSDNAKAYKLYGTEETDYKDGARPSVYRIPKELGYKRPQNTDKAEKRHYNTESGYHPQWLY